MRLSDMGRTLQRAVTQALRQWARETSNQLRAAAPVATGQLRRSVRVRPEPTGAMIIAPVVQATTTDKGAKPHPINPRRKKALAWQTSSGMMVIGPLVKGGWLASSGGVRRRKFLATATWLKRTTNAVNHPGNAGTGWWSQTVRKGLAMLGDIIASVIRSMTR